MRCLGGAFLLNKDGNNLISSFRSASCNVHPLQHNQHKYTPGRHGNRQRAYVSQVPLPVCARSRACVLRVALVFILCKGESVHCLLCCTFHVRWGGRNIVVRMRARLLRRDQWQRGVRAVRLCVTDTLRNGEFIYTCLLMACQFITYVSHRPLAPYSFTGQFFYTIFLSFVYLLSNVGNRQTMFSLCCCFIG